MIYQLRFQLTLYSELEEKMKKCGLHQQSFSWLGEYDVVSKIGDGTTAVVYKATGKAGEIVSIKVIKPSYYQSKLGFQLVQNEIKILKTLTHENILNFVTSIEKGDKVAIITSYCDAGDLEKYLAKHKRLQEKQVLIIMKKVAEACLHLKNKHVVHRDIKPANIFLHCQSPVIADFGFSLLGNDTSLSKVNAGSPLYMPIESLRQKVFTQKSDVFAFGVCLFELLSGDTPWRARTQDELMEKLKFPPTLSINTSQKVKKLILQCLSYDAHARPSFDQVLESIDSILKIRAPFMTITHNNVCMKKESTNKPESISKLIKENKKCEAQNINRKGKSITVHCYQNSNSMRVLKNETEFLNRLQPEQFAFLPESVITKFKIILYQYKKILGMTGQENISIQTEDALVEKVQSCSTELELCLVIENFIRRLFRLSKNYSQYKKCHQDIDLLKERVTSLLVA